MAYVDSSPARDHEPNRGKEAKKPAGRLAKYWKEIEAYGKTSSDWKDQGDKIVKLYLDQHRTTASPRRFALLWSNIETLKPAVYAKTPTVLCSRRYRDPHPTGRVAAEILERATNTTFDLGDVGEVFRMVRDDRLLVARGQAWVRYEADFKTAKDDKGEEYEKVSGEKVCVDYVHWCDFGHNVAGTWKDVWLVWRKVHKTRDEATKRFGKEVAEKLAYSAKADPDGKEEPGEHTACIYECWDRKKRQTIFISRDVPEFLEEPGDPPLNFRDFFPCPEPCYGSKTGKSLIPTPDYRYYQDQANEIDDLTDKIANLTEYLQVRAFVPAGPSADGADAVRMMIESLQSQMTANKSIFIPVESWAGFTEKGGAGKLIDWLPIDMVIKALQGAVETRNQLIQDVYQITGIADILRGQTDPEETLGAQQLKAQTGARRVRNSKDELARFCCDIGQLVAEVIAEQFQPQTIADMTGYAYTPGNGPIEDPQAQQLPQPAMPQPVPQQPGMPQTGAMASPPMVPPQAPSGQTFNDDVMQLLRNDRMRGFLIDIETDSTIQPDEDAEKQRRTEFIMATGNFLKETAQVLPGAPALAPMVSEMLLFLVRGFRAGRSLEEVIERSMKELATQMQQAAANPPPDPKMEAEKVKAQAAAQKAQADMALVQQKSAAEMEKMRGEVMKMQYEMQFMMQKLGVQREESMIKLNTAQQEAAIDAQAQARESEASEREHAMTMASAERQHELGQESMHTKHEIGIEAMQAKAKQAKQFPARK